MDDIEPPGGRAQVTGWLSRFHRLVLGKPPGGFDLAIDINAPCQHGFGFPSQRNFPLASAMRLVVSYAGVWRKCRQMIRATRIGHWMKTGKFMNKNKDKRLRKVQYALYAPLSMFLIRAFPVPHLRCG